MPTPRVGPNHAFHQCAQPAATEIPAISHVPRLLFSSQRQHHVVLMHPACASPGHALCSQWQVLQSRHRGCLCTPARMVCRSASPQRHAERGPSHCSDGMPRRQSPAHPSGRALLAARTVAGRPLSADITGCKRDPPSRSSLARGPLVLIHPQISHRGAGGTRFLGLQEEGYSPPQPYPIGTR